MLWPAKLLLFSAFVATIGSADSAISEEKYRTALVQGLQGEIRKDVLDRLGALSHEVVKRVYTVCCNENDRCMAGSVAFLVREHKRFTYEGVGTFALYPKHYFLDRVKRLKDVPMDLSHPEHLDEAALVKGLGRWYEDIGYEIKDVRAFRRAVEYALLYDERPCTERARARILLRLAGRENSQVLSEYWQRQPASRQRIVYRNAVSRRVYWDLSILQPTIFNMDCITDSGCTEADYKTAFRVYAASAVLPVGLKFIPEDSLFHKVAKVLRKMTGRAAVENLGTDKWKLLPFLPLELPKEVALKMATLGSDTPLGHADYAILDAADLKTWRVLDHQLCVLLGQEAVEFVQGYPSFPHAYMAGYIGPYATLTHYVEQYWVAIIDILQRLLRIEVREWFQLGLPKYLGVDTLWRLFAFLEKNPQYGGLFGALIVWSVGDRKGCIDELEPAGLEVLVSNIICDTDEGRRHKRLNSIAAHLVEKELERKEHPYFEDRYKLFREQCRSILSTIFKRSVYVRPSLEEYILSIPAEVGGQDGLHDLQVALVIRNYGQCRSDLWAVGEMSGYSTEQLRNIYMSEHDTEVRFRALQISGPQGVFT